MSWGQASLGRLARDGILLALRGSEQPEAALAEARMLAATLHEELRVIRVVKEPSRWRRLLGGPGRIERLRHEHFATRRWLVDHLGELGSRIRLTVSYGAFSERTALEARAAGSALVIVAPDSVSASAVGDLARRSGAAVLVARIAGRTASVLVATDLKLPDTPVVARAANLARDLHSELVALHNADALWAPSGVTLPEVALPVVLPGVSVTQQQRQRLAAVTDNLPIPATPVVTSLIDPVYAILHEAEVRDAGLIVVGTRERPAWDRLLSGSVATQVVKRAKQSVMVTPIG